MCGINGIISKKPLPEMSAHVHKMNDLIIHRGPDSEGLYNYKNKVALGIRRLSIIDLVSGDQPIYNEDKSLVIVFNGEIYNFKELKKDLINKGVNFQTNTDTEVILKLYELYNEKSFNLLNGAFAFSIFDIKKDKIFIARDRFGKKPLFYYKDENMFVWSSELKSLMSFKKSNNVLSKFSINLFFTLSFIPSPFTIYNNVFKLDPANYLEIDCLTLYFKKKSFWTLDVLRKPVASNYLQAKKELEILLFDSVEKRMISDVPIGAFLSGGVDSSIVTSIMAKISNTQIQTFSIAYKDKKYDESGKAALVSTYCRTNHHSHMLLPEQLIDDIDKIIINFDEPFGDSSALPTFFVSKIAKQNVTVVLTGDGGDEAFAGYNRYAMDYYRNVYRKIIPTIIHQNIISKSIANLSSRNEDTKSKIYRIRKFIDSVSDSDLASIYSLMSLGFHDNERSQLLTQDFYSKDIFCWLEGLYKPVESLTYLKKARYLDQHISLEGDMLVKVDRTSMLNSLECRSPFLDYRIFEFTNELPDSFLMKGLDKKKILKDTFSKMLPEKLFNAPKSGFEVPVSKWLRNELLSDFKKITAKELIEEQGVLNYGLIDTLLNEHKTGRKDHSTKLWLIYCFEKWYNSSFLKCD